MKRRALWLCLSFVCGCASANHVGLAEANRVMRPDDLSYAATDPPSSVAGLFYEYKEPGIVVVAIRSGSSLEDESLSAPANRRDGEPTADSLEVQMQLVVGAASHGSVIILVPDGSTESHLRTHCRRFSGLCDVLAKDAVRFVVVTHDGEWVRDFGPMIAWDTHGKAIVLDSRYYDIRSHQADQYKRHQINERRLSVLIRQNASQNDASDDNDDEDDDDSGLSTLTRRFKLDSDYEYLTKLSDVLKDDAEFERDLDDLAPYSIAEALFTPESFNLYRPPLFLDGGNLIQLEGGRCLTTTDLISANGGRDDIVRSALKYYFGCSQVVFLTPLPGPVIKHVDMFLMPVSRDRVLLASYLPQDYDPNDEEERAAYLESLETAGQDLFVAAAVAMRDNEQKLAAAGITVTRVPGLLPRVDGDRIYYPTNLNALIRVAPDGTRQVFVPVYSGYATRQQDQAVRVIAKAFGPGTEVVRIEATAAAKLQGAVHCLSIVVPSRLTYIMDPGHEILRKSIADILRDRKQRMADVQELNLTGTWTVKHATALPPGLEFLFREHDLSIVDNEKGTLAHFLYDGLRVRQRTWIVNLKDSETDPSPDTVSIEWLSPRDLRFTYGKNKETVELQRKPK